MASFGFDTTEYESSTDFEVMPKGEYTLKATDCELKKTKSGEGAYLSVTFEVVKPSAFNGRKVWQNFNIHNPSDKAQKIGREQVSGWARACGKPNAADSDALLERQFACKLDIEKGTGGYSDKNIIKGFLTEGESGKSVSDTPKKSSKFDDEPAPKREEPKEEPKRKESKQEESKPAPAKKNPWDD